MIYKLQRKFILICTASVLVVVTLMFGIIFTLNISSMNKNMDELTDRISANGGRFGITTEEPKHDIKPPKNKLNYNFITPETPFSTRYFAAFYNKNGAVVRTQTDSIYSITEEQAADLAQKVLSTDKERGWISSYRYKVFYNDFGYGVVFVDGSVSRSAFMQSTSIAGIVLIACSTLVLILVSFLSKKVVKPIAESYEKQKQFITDANHELKTPLTLILANLDIAEAELGPNEWLDDIRSEGHRMTELVNQLITLSRMDEEGHPMNVIEVSLGELVADTVSEFEPLVKDRGKALVASVDKKITYLGDEALLHRLIGILIDNAIKYCDQGGEISVTLRRGRRVLLTVENTYVAIDEIELNRLFDRFYRADKARKFTGGYGVGLSMAKAIVEKHKGEIIAYKKDSTHIGFKVVL